MRLARSFGCAIKGIFSALEGQLNIKIHLLAIIMVTAAGLYARITTIEWCIILICFAVVLAAELFNSSIETIVDLVSPGHNPLAGKAKDIAAGAVLVTAIISVIIAVLIFAKYFTAIH